MPDPSESRPAPPEDLDGEALLEWSRVCDELESAGTLAATDRALLSLWCVTWAVWKAVTAHVNKFGPIVPAANRVIGRSPWYQVQRETHRDLVKMAQQLGLRSREKKDEESTLPDF